jgi:hypothetical protein
LLRKIPLIIIESTWKAVFEDYLSGAAAGCSRGKSVPALYWFHRELNANECWYSMKKIKDK